MSGLYMTDNRDVKNVLCTVRSVNWTEAVKRTMQPEAGRKIGPFYQIFMKDDAPDNGWTSIINKHLNGLTLWRDMTADEIIQEVKDSPEECRQAFSRLIGRYWAACKAYLIDIAPSNEWQTYLVDRFHSSRVLTTEDIPVWTGRIEDEAFQFISFLDEAADVSIRILMERMFAVQEAQILLSETGVVGGQKADARQKLSDAVFEAEIFPILDDEFPIGGDNKGIKKRCGEIGMQYGVSESTIKRLFYDTQCKTRNKRSG